MFPSESAEFSDSEIENLARSSFNDLVIKENATLIRDIECDSYQIDGRKACSYIISTGGIGANKVMGVMGQAEGTTYAFTYGSPAQHFDDDIPTFNKMLQSFDATNLETN